MPAYAQTPSPTQEIVEVSPARALPRTLQPSEAATLPAGGSLARMRQAGAKGRREFVSMRGPLGSIKLAITHVPVLHALWRLWAANRVSGAENPGVSMKALSEALGQPSGAFRHIIHSLVRNGAVAAQTRYVGWRGARALYAPTESGVQMIGLISVLPMGSSVQVGRTDSAWRSRSSDEPSNLFQYAALLRGGAPVEPVDPEYP